MNMLDQVITDLTTSVYITHVRGLLAHHAYVLKKALSVGQLQQSLDYLVNKGDLSGKVSIQKALEVITEQDVNAGRPLLTAIIVSENGLPELDFFELCRKLGKKIGDGPTGEASFWRDQLRDLGIPDTCWDPIFAFLSKALKEDKELEVLSQLWPVPEAAEAQPVPDIKVPRWSNRKSTEKGCSENPIKTPQIEESKGQHLKVSCQSVKHQGSITCVTTSELGDLKTAGPISRPQPTGPDGPILNLDSVVTYVENEVERPATVTHIWTKSLGKGFWPDVNLTVLHPDIIDRKTSVPYNTQGATIFWKWPDE